MTVKVREREVKGPESQTQLLHFCNYLSCGLERRWRLTVMFKRNKCDL